MNCHGTDREHLLRSFGLIALALAACASGFMISESDESDATTYDYNEIIAYGSTVNYTVGLSITSLDTFNDRLSSAGWNFEAYYNSDLGVTSITGNATNNNGSKSENITFTYTLADSSVSFNGRITIVSGTEGYDQVHFIRYGSSYHASFSSFYEFSKSLASDLKARGWNDLTVGYEETSGSVNQYKMVIVGEVTSVTGKSAIIPFSNGSKLCALCIVDDSAPKFVSTVSISGNDTLKVGSSLQLSATTGPSTANTDRTVTWAITSGSNYATIESTTDKTTGGICTLKGLSVGNVTIKATADDGSAYCSKTIAVEAPVYEHTLKFDAMGGSGAPSSITGSSATGSYTFTIPATIPSKTGHSFLGWSEFSNATAAKYAVGDSYTSTANSATLYAVWKQNEYICTLNYSATGATNVPDSDTYKGSSTADHAFTISANRPSRDGYTFLGWSTTNGSPTAEYQSGGKISVAYNGTVTLYAVWVENTYTCTLKYSTEGASNVPPDDVFIGSTTDAHIFTISSIIPAKEGHIFLGWSSTDEAAEADYQPGDSISVEHDGTTALHAVWKLIVYTAVLEYSAAGATNVPESQSYSGTSTDAHVFTISSAVPLRTGCAFLGWSTIQDASVADYPSGGTISVECNGTVTLYAVWDQTERTFILEYSAVGASNVPATQVYTGPSNGTCTFRIVKITPVLDNHFFLGWSTEPDATTAPYYGGKDIIVNHEGTTILYAVWIPCISVTSYPPVSCKLGETYCYNIQTNVEGCTVRVSGVSWLKVTGNTISGIPYTADTTFITIHVSKEGHQSCFQQFDLTVYEEYDSLPSADGIFAYAR